MRSQEVWDFAQAYSARRMIRLGLGLLATGTIAALSIKMPYELVLGTGIPLLLAAWMIVLVEREILKKFPKKPKQKP